jgi:MFS family permease
MSIYAFTLAGGNFLAPVICGFIAEYQGWQWVFYYPSIFLAVVFVFLFFVLEETNFERLSVGIVENLTRTSSKNELPNEKEGPEDATEEASDLNPVNSTISGYHKKTYFQKLSLSGTRREENTIIRRVRQTIYFLSWPVIFYSG